MARETILQEAEFSVSHNDLEDLEAASQAWTAVLRKDITAEQVALCRIAQQLTKPPTRASLLCIVRLARLLEMMGEEGWTTAPSALPAEPTFQYLQGMTFSPPNETLIRDGRAVGESK